MRFEKLHQHHRPPLYCHFLNYAIDCAEVEVNVFVQAGAESVPVRSAMEVQANHDCHLVNGDAESELLVLQARPIGEPVAQFGPFVMNTQQEIHQAFADYRRTEFRGWPWGANDPVHLRDKGRFARHADGKLKERS
jgi:hypothetical protein